MVFDQFLLYHYQLDLQLFASAEDEGRTEDATERRKKEKREQGQTPKSPELVTAGVFLVVFSTFIMFFSTFIEIILSMMEYYLSHLNMGEEPMTYSRLYMFNSFFFQSLIPLLAVSVISAVVMNIIQVGFLITPKALEPKMERINFTLAKVREKILFSKPVMLNLVFSIARVVFLTVVFIIFIRINLDQILNLTSMGLMPAIKVIISMIVKIFLFSGVFLFLIGIPDFLAKRKQFQDSLKMTKSDVKREVKQEDGDPRMKAQMREMFNKILQKQNIQQRVPKADVIITNPTHFAVALQYQMDSMEFPMVLAKGEDDTALMIRKIATDNDIDIIENPPLARELYKIVNVGDYIPEHLTFVIAEIFIGLYKKGKWNMDNITEEQKDLG